MTQMIRIDSVDKIPKEYRDTPIALLLEYHNLERPYTTHSQAQLLIGMCMDHRNHLHIPDYFAYIIRTGGANLRYSEFKVSYAISVGGIRHIALIGHNNCGMVNLMSRKEKFIQGLVEGAGWEPNQAEEHFMSFAPMFETGNETDFILSEAKRLRARYPKVRVAPMLYKIEEGRLYLLEAT